MTTVNLIPPSDGQHNSISVNGRTYASPAISGAGHLIGALGHLINNNTNTLGLGIGIEGKIDNTNAGSIITTAISVDANLGSNAGVIGAWYGVYSDLGGNAVIIGNAAFYGCNIDSNPGTIGNVYGL